MKLVGKHKPQGDGVLIFDEVKVACQLIWNSRSQTLSGLAMTSKDLSSLNDVYRILEQPDSPKQTSYILQFLWRDLTSNYDIVGPYFTCSESVDGKFIYACIFETLRLFQAHGLKTSLLVCDGCPANLTTIKTSHGFSGAYSVLPADSTGDQYAIKPWFINPFNPPNLIYWMICPTHQVCHLIVHSNWPHIFTSWRTWSMPFFPPRVVALNSSNEAKNIVILGGTPLFTCTSGKLGGLNYNKPGWCLVWKRCTALETRGQSWMSHLQR